jgi:hypothetical protein
LINVLSLEAGHFQAEEKEDVLSLTLIYLGVVLSYFISSLELKVVERPFEVIFDYECAIIKMFKNNNFLNLPSAAF